MNNNTNQVENFELVSSAGKEAAHIQQYHNALNRQQRLQRIRSINRSHFEHSVWSYFPTPPAVIRQLIKHAQLADGMSILEPSAGKGAIARRVNELWDCSIQCVEREPDFREILQLYGFNVIGSDFVGIKPKPIYDRVIANPPFDAQMSHIQHMYKWLKPGGKLITVANAVFLEPNKQKYKAAEYGQHRGTGSLYHQFLTWLDSTNALVTRLPQSSFANASRTTNVNTVIITVNR